MSQNIYRAMEKNTGIKMRKKEWEAITVASATLEQYIATTYIS